ncbi:mitogen-activated protein kinase kinase kinase 20-like [Macadamia integrifolia]|uniref:mitogen-activated protein kinase kinase kinase 20-like n=1 Tax=Macadamia integrifolia TaxID=60698 RepID=UPI001C4E6A7F|nr:mitogen-activated protein kinase kinase kinase 20-like [Macadamia integrifolia]
MEWKRGKSIGRGSFCSVNLAIPAGGCCSLVEEPQLMAVKSAAISECSSLQREREILARFIDCPQIVRCLGDDHTIEKGQEFYNVFLEYASRGTLAGLIKESGGALLESDVRRYTRSILTGLRCIHEKGFVHCDIKLQNILIYSSPDGTDDVKIADFGLAKKAEEVEKLNLRGTPLYMSPESIACNEHEAPGDVWSLGCAVAEMVIGRPAWKCRADSDVSALLFRIAFGEELPEIPEEMSEQGKDFLRRCFVRDPSKRWTAEMLLNHPFVADNTVSLPQSDKPSSSRSPRSAFDFPEWRCSTQSSLFSSISSCSLSPDSYSCEQGISGQPNFYSSSPVDRIRKLATQKFPNWGSSDSWILVRQGQAEAESSSSPVFS